MAIRRGGDEVSEREQQAIALATHLLAVLPTHWDYAEIQRRAKELLAASPAAPTPKPENLKWENLKWLLDASNQVIKELGKQEHLDSETFRWLRNAVGQVERDLQRALQVAGVPSGKLEELQNAANWMWEQAERKDIGPSRREAFELSARRLDAALAEEGK
jgi:hypothetical protein